MIKTEMIHRIKIKNFSLSLSFFLISSMKMLVVIRIPVFPLSGQKLLLTNIFHVSSLVSSLVQVKMSDILLLIVHFSFLSSFTGVCLSLKKKREKNFLLCFVVG